MGGSVVAQSNGYLPCHRLPWSPPCLGFVEHARRFTVDANFSSTSTSSLILRVCICRRYTGRCEYFSANKEMEFIGSTILRWREMSWNSSSLAPLRWSPALTGSANSAAKTGRAAEALKPSSRPRPRLVSSLRPKA